MGDKRNFKTRQLNIVDGDVAGIKTITIEIEGEYCFGWLKGENGVHRLVRISLLIVMQKDILLLLLYMYTPLVDESIEIGMLLIQKLIGILCVQVELVDKA